ncbi:MAG: hypothetical protein ACRCYY_10045 [Trueperaceae bacterium]
MITWDTMMPTQQDNYLLAAKLSGYRFVPKEFRYPTTATRSSSVQLVSKWSNKEGYTFV